MVIPATVPTPHSNWLRLLRLCLKTIALSLRLAADDAACRTAGDTLPYGGQAVIEGVMMKGKAHAAVAVRRRNSTIEVMEKAVSSRFGALAKAPGIRGFFILVDMMTLGMWALQESGKRAQEDEELEQSRLSGKPLEVKPQRPGSKLLENIVMFLSLALALLMFKVAPAAAATGIFSLIGWGALQEMAAPTLGQQFLANLVEGLIKLAIFVGYIWLIARLKEVQRVFEYHGAEHIVINAYENDASRVQDVGFIQQHGVAHPRCGTSFIVILILLSVLLFTLLDWGLLELGAPAVHNLPVWWIRWPLRIVGLIPLSGLSYEFIKAAFKYYGNPLLRPLLRFGMLFQALTTRRPSDAQVEVSLASFNRARYLSEGIAEPTV
jgi:uncharacterized protein YqhQ